MQQSHHYLNFLKIILFKFKIIRSAYSFKQQAIKFSEIFSRLKFSDKYNNFSKENRTAGGSRLSSIVWEKTREAMQLKRSIALYIRSVEMFVYFRNTITSW